MRHFLSSLIVAFVMAASSGFLFAADKITHVKFQSMDGKTTLDGYLFVPANHSAKSPAVVMMHGRSGAYSSLADGTYDATTLMKRHLYWGHHWTDKGYVALLVDSFSARGYPDGFPMHSYDSRPDEVNEVTVRPLDAYGGLRFLKSRSDVDPKHIVLQGWSNGGSATIASLSPQGLAAAGVAPADGFAAGVAFYPACGLHDQFNDGFQPVAPLRVFSGDNDEEVSAAHCKRLIDAIKVQAGDAQITIYPGATHDFDEPSKSRQDDPANVAAFADAVQKVDGFVKVLVGK
jgi:carboxymethylenebutenolidase